MSTSMWGYTFIIVGLMAAFLLILFGGINTKGEQNYYLIKESMQNAMLDSVDENAYKVGLEQSEVDSVSTINCESGKPGTVRIVTEKFVENFTRRFAESANLSQEYRIEIYDIQECPAKVSLKVISKENYTWIKRFFTGDTKNEETLIVSELSGILESKE